MNILVTLQRNVEYTINAKGTGLNRIQYEKL